MLLPLIVRTAVAVFLIITISYKINQSVYKLPPVKHQQLPYNITVSNPIGQWTAIGVHAQNMYLTWIEDCVAV